MIDTTNELKEQMLWSGAQQSAAESAKYVIQESEPEEMCNMIHKVMANEGLSLRERKLIAAAIIITIVAVAPESKIGKESNLQ